MMIEEALENFGELRAELATEDSELLAGLQQDTNPGG